MIYEKYQRNHVILPGREKALESFLKQDYKGMQHKLRNAVSSNSEDALTWSCFDVLTNLPFLDKAAALDELLEDAFQGNSPLSFKARAVSRVKTSKFTSGNPTQALRQKRLLRWMQALRRQAFWCS